MVGKCQSEDPEDSLCLQASKTQMLCVFIPSKLFVLRTGVCGVVKIN